MNFFNICQEMERDKKVYKREVEAFVATHKNMLKRMEREVLKGRGGQGKNYVDAPNDQSERKKEFLQFSRDEVRSSRKYREWLDEKCSLFLTAAAEKEKRTSENDNADNQIKLVRQRLYI